MEECNVGSFQTESQHIPGWVRTGEYRKAEAGEFRVLVLDNGINLACAGPTEGCSHILKPDRAYAPMTTVFLCQVAVYIRHIFYSMNRVPPFGS